MYRSLVSLSSCCGCDDLLLLLLVAAVLCQPIFFSFVLSIVVRLFLLLRSLTLCCCYAWFCPSFCCYSRFSPSFSFIFYFLYIAATLFTAVCYCLLIMLLLTASRHFCCCDCEVVDCLAIFTSMCLLVSSTFILRSHNNLFVPLFLFLEFVRTRQG